MGPMASAVPPTLRLLSLFPIPGKLAMEDADAVPSANATLFDTKLLRDDAIASVASVDEHDDGGGSTFICDLGGA